MAIETWFCTRDKQALHDFFYDETPHGLKVRYLECILPAMDYDGFYYGCVSSEKPITLPKHIHPAEPEKGASVCSEPCRSMEEVRKFRKPEGYNFA